jgi:nickel-dependent lactate racemase
VKSAVIGLGSKASIQKNHQMLTDEFATIGVYEENPLRQDIEESGEMIGIDFALNAILTEEKKIAAAFFGKPKDVMVRGIAIVRQMSSVKLKSPYDIVIASAGGFPKDINLYQAQKAISHARLFARRGGTIILVAECREGLGSQALETFIKDVKSIPDIYDKFNKMGFVIGAHKAVQIARQLETHQIILVSSIKPETVKSVLITPAASIAEAIEIANRQIGKQPSFAVLPYATGVFPAI